MVVMVVQLIERLLTNALWALNRHSGTVDLMFVN